MKLGVTLPNFRDEPEPTLAVARAGRPPRSLPRSTRSLASLPAG